MDATFFEHIQETLTAKRQSLVMWLRSTPIDKKIVRLESATRRRYDYRRLQDRWVIMTRSHKDWLMKESLQ